MQSFRSLPRAASSFRAFSTTSPRPLAKMQLIGRLADAPEHMNTSTGRDLTKFALGVTTGGRDENGNRPTSWFNCVSFVEGPQRDLLVSLQKGTQMYVEARASMDSYTDRDGNSRKSLGLIASQFEVLSARSDRASTSTDPEGEESHRDSAAEEPRSGLGAS